MQEGMHMTQENRYTYKIFLDNSLIHSEWEHEIFSLSIWGLAKYNWEARECNAFLNLSFVILSSNT